jgi:hypothetical protein
MAAKMARGRLLGNPQCLGKVDMGPQNGLGTGRLPMDGINSQNKILNGS